MVWFFWPVSVALVSAGSVYRLAGQRAWGGAALAGGSAALAVVPLIVAVPVVCSDGVTLAVSCGGTSEPKAWHLGVAAAVLVTAAATGVLEKA